MLGKSKEEKGKNISQKRINARLYVSLSYLDNWSINSIVSKSDSYMEVIAPAYVNECNHITYAYEEDEDEDEIAGSIKNNISFENKRVIIMINATGSLKDLKMRARINGNIGIGKNNDSNNLELNIYLTTEEIKNIFFIMNLPQKEPNEQRPANDPGYPLSNVGLILDIYWLFSENKDYKNVIGRRLNQFYIDSMECHNEYH